jgi:DNA-binding protein HU-beta
MRLGLGRRQAQAAVEAFFGGVSDALGKGQSVSIVGFGVWEWTERSARRVHDPRNMKKIDLPGRSKLVFKPSEAFKRRLNEGKH